MATFSEGQVIQMANTNAYNICADGKRYSCTVRTADSVLYKVWFSREAEDAEGSLRAKSNYSEEFVSVPVEEITQIPGIPLDILTEGDMITGSMVFSTHVEP